MPCPFHESFNRLIAPPNGARVIFAAAAISLIFAFIMQYTFGYDPCVLCLWQRVPFGVAIILSAFALRKRPSSSTWILLALCALAFFINTGLAAFHTGVERHWWLGTNGCAITPLDQAPIQSLREKLLSTPTAHCDVISWTLFGLSMANYNIPFSFVLALFSALAAKKAKA